MEGAHDFVAAPGMEINAGASQVGVAVRNRCGDAGVQHLYILSAGGVLQRVVQPGAKTTATAVLPQIDAGFRRPGVGCAAAQLSGVGIAHDLAIAFYDQVRMRVQCVFNTLAEVIQRGHFILKCDGGFDDIGRIDIQQRRGVIRDCGADMYHMQHLLSLCCV